jgi:ribose transport system ATP-binding protein
LSTEDTILQMKGISKAFPGVQALDRVDFEVAAGEVMALVGENGAGKSTLMKILSGAYRKDEGQTLLNGKQVEIESPRHAQELGIAIIYQEFNLAPNQTVAANIFVGREPRHSGLARLLVDRRKMVEEAQIHLDNVGARVSAATLVRDLSVAEQQMVEVAKALAVDAQVIVMDEPTSALGEDEVERLFEIISALKEKGIGIVFITHRLEEVFRVADRVTVLRDGRRVGGMTIGEATPAKIINLMVGRELTEMFHKAEAEIGTPVLEVKGLTRSGSVEDVGFSLRRGEILGFAGLVGAGRTETLRLLFGADRRDSGEIYVDGKPVRIHSPVDALSAGIGLVPEDRGTEGLVLNLSVLRNVVLPTLDRHAKAGVWMDGHGLRDTAEEYVEDLDIKTPSLEQKAIFLSGGNQQKVVVAKWLATEPRVLIMDEPTRGIDVGAKAEVHSIMTELAQAGVAIIMASSELPEILGMSDRILVMCEGRVAAILDRDEADQETIMAYASGEGAAGPAAGCAD